MNRNWNWKWVYNPFEKIAGWKAFGIGIVILCIATVIGYFGNMVFYGISIKGAPYLTWGKAFSLHGLGLAVTVIVMWIIALLSAKHVRFQDMLGTITLAKYPLVIEVVLLLAFSKRMNEFTDRIVSAGSIQGIMEVFNNLTILDYTLLFVHTMIALLFLVWTIALLFNAFRVSTNLKGGKCVLLFVAGVLISEIIIQVIILNHLVII